MILFIYKCSKKNFQKKTLKKAIKYPFLCDDCNWMDKNLPAIYYLFLAGKQALQEGYLYLKVYVSGWWIKEMVGFLS